MKAHPSVGNVAKQQTVATRVLPDSLQWKHPQESVVPSPALRTVGRTTGGALERIDQAVEKQFLFNDLGEGNTVVALAPCS